MEYDKNAPKVYQTKVLLDMKRRDLLAVAKEHGMKMSAETPDDEIVAFIMAQQSEAVEAYNKQQVRKSEAIKRGEEEKPKPNPKQPQPPAGVAKAGDMKLPVSHDEARIWFKVAAGSTALEQADVFAALNGESILVKRGQWVQLKKKFITIFEDAIITIIEIDREGNKTARDVPRFNFMTRSLEDGVPVERNSSAVRAF